MKINTVEIDRLRELFTYDQETGFLIRKKMTSIFRAGSRSGTKLNDGRRRVCVDRTLLAEGRVVWALHYGKWPDGEVDHIDRNPSNNKIENLRDVNHQKNMWNRPASKNSKTGIKGVLWHPKTKKWQAKTSMGGKTTYFGLHKTLEDAKAAYDNGIKKIIGDFHIV